MQLESFPNEILLDLFKLFDTIHLLRAFFGLNSRFNQLICAHFRNHSFDLQCISKNDFDEICRENIPFILDHITSLNLSQDETPHLVEFLLSYGFTLDRFVCLQSLSLHGINSLDLLIKIVFECYDLPHFTHLNIINCDIQEEQQRISRLLNKIWSISKLIYCNLNGIQSRVVSLRGISVISSSMEHLLIENIRCDLSGFFHLFECAPRLQRLSTNVSCNLTDEKMIFVMLPLTSLKISFQGSYNSLKMILSAMPNLYRLTISTFGLDLNGHTWEQIIIEYLPKLEVFQWKMENELLDKDENDIDKMIDQLLTTFQTPFWIKERQWYVRCSWNPSKSYKWMILHTLPYVFPKFIVANKYHSKSTCTNEEQYWLCNRVQTYNLTDASLESLSLVCTQCPNLHSLNITLPFSDEWFSKDLIFNQLTSLGVRILNNTIYGQLQRILDRSPHLHSLQIRSYPSFIAQVFQLSSKTIRRLTIIKQVYSYNPFTRKECFALCESNLGRQCEVLVVEVEDPLGMMDLIQGLPNLRLLNLRCTEEMKRASTDTELVRWLDRHMSSTHTVISYLSNSSLIQIWIDQHEKQWKFGNSSSKGENKLSRLFKSIQKIFIRK